MKFYIEVCNWGFGILFVAYLVIAAGNTMLILKWLNKWTPGEDSLL